MKKKNGVNIMLFVLIMQLFFMFSCTKNSKKSQTGMLIKTDLAFSDMSEKDGMHKAFLVFFADSGVILRDNGYPVKGKKALMELYSKRPDTSFILTWKPIYEKISDSGDLGYTYGFYRSRQKSTGEISQGTYLTIWEKQTDGSWKFVMDTGTQGLPEEKN
jgi:ketosteroid isomerase-like protein